MADDLEAGTEGEALASPTLRRCIVTRQALEKPAMIRFVIDPDGQVTPDLKERLPGRGLWVTATRDALDPSRCTACLFQGGQAIGEGRRRTSPTG